MSKVGRPKREPTCVHGIRLPNRLWEQLQDICRKEYRPLNAQMWMIIEDWLVEHGHIKDEDRKR